MAEGFCTEYVINRGSVVTGHVCGRPLVADGTGCGIHSAAANKRRAEKSNKASDVREAKATHNYNLVSLRRAALLLDQRGLALAAKTCRDLYDELARTDSV